MDGNKSNLFQELITKQRSECKDSRKLTLSDIKRISKNINQSIFDCSCCSLWNGYVTNKTQKTKTSYINFYFRHKKVALHRLLYENYVSDIPDNQYIKYSCDNKGVCCNLNHMYTLDVIKPVEEPEKKTPLKKKDSNLIVNFD